MKNNLKMKLTIYKKFSDLEHKYYPPHNPSGYSENAGSRARYHQTCRSPTCTPWPWRTGQALGSGHPGWVAVSRSTLPRQGLTCLECLARIYRSIQFWDHEQLFIAQYYRHLSANIKREIIRLKPVLQAPKGRRPGIKKNVINFMIFI